MEEPAARTYLILIGPEGGDSELGLQPAFAWKTNVTVIALQEQLPNIAEQSIIIAIISSNIVCAAVYRCTSSRSIWDWPADPCSPAGDTERSVRNRVD